MCPKKGTHKHMYRCFLSISVSVYLEHTVYSTDPLIHTESLDHSGAEQTPVPDKQTHKSD